MLRTHSSTVCVDCLFQGHLAEPLTGVCVDRLFFKVIGPSPYGLLFSIIEYEKILLLDSTRCVCVYMGLDRRSESKVRQLENVRVLSVYF